MQLVEVVAQASAPGTTTLFVASPKSGLGIIRLKRFVNCLFILPLKIVVRLFSRDDVSDFNHRRREFGVFRRLR